MTSISRPDAATVRKLADGHVAIVTGAARGIGFATATLLAQHGARVVLVDLHKTNLQQACAKIGPQSTYEVCDVSDWDQQLALFEKVTTTIGPISLLVCNAAVNPEIALLQPHTPGERDEMNKQVRYNYLADEPSHAAGGPLQRPPTRLFDTNVNSVVFGLKLGIHYMKRHGGGRIVVVGSAGSYVPIPSQPLYAASKHAVLGLVRSTASIEEVIKGGMAISWIAPWLTLTSMVEGLDATIHPDTLKSSPEDVAWAVLAAASAEEANGKGYWVQGAEISEVEGPYLDLVGRLMSPANRF